MDTETLCRERDREKDQIMLDFQILPANLYDWVARSCFAPDWRNPSLERATQMIHRKSGRVTGTTTALKWFSNHAATRPAICDEDHLCPLQCCQCALA